MTTDEGGVGGSRADVPVLIVGAGPTGLVLALWLTRLGVRVRIIDKAAGPGTTSRALAVQARTLEFYRQVGLADAAIAGGVKVANLNFWVKGTRAARVPLRHIGEGSSPYPFALVFPQDAHERLLIDRLETLGVRVERRTELLRFERRDGGVRATLRREGGPEEACDAAYLAGCDGASSTVRERLAVGFPGGTYTGLFYVADVEATGPATDDELHADLEEADFLLVFPLKGEGRLRLVGVVRDVPGREHGDLTFDDVKGKAIGHLKLDIQGVNWFSTYRVHHRVAHHFRMGRAFLLGDAAHVHSPVGGQGMNTGIGDAVNLAWKLAAVLNGGAADDLLDTYEPERIAFARRLVATTDRAFTMVTARGFLARFVRTRLVPRLVPSLFRLPPLRRFLFETLSQVGVHYRHSRLSEGAAGAVRGGDRLPWVETAPGRDNFAPLASIAWQAHVYGEAPVGLEEACAGRGLPLHVFPWQPSMRRAGLRRGALYLVRPDGYVAMADPQADPARLRAYRGCSCFEAD
ncbi:MAG TPA: FAD-dependent monooxygenase [Isosphaeraceae bacterium]|jgi:2-polyprenyl-6-methoxyphenol hydroxylase-like FAD-dependent oxidoreductase|nr:FAD-dependent monooxygenase [Isosphaeraceae bacterium]